MESVTCLRWRSATPPVLMHQDRPGRSPANFRIIRLGAWTGTHGKGRRPEGPRPRTMRTYGLG
jgi:hypothetical protein